MNFLAAFFATDHQTPGWRQIGEGFAGWVLIGALVVAALAMVLKCLLDRKALAIGDGGEAFRGPHRSRVAMLVGAIAFVAFLFLVWVVSHDHRAIVRLAGLAKGIIVGLLEYCVLFIIFCAIGWRNHLPWR